MYSTALYAFRCALLMLPVLLLISCEGDDPAGPPPITIPEAGEAIVYSKHIEPIWLNTCSGSDCHIDGENFAGLSLDTWDDLVAGSDYGTMIIPFASARSMLFQHINVDTNFGPIAEPHMPLDRDPLTHEQVTLIKRWIDEGARNDDGDVPLEDGNRDRLFVTCQTEDILAVIDLATENVARLLSVGVRPDSTSPPEAAHNLALSPDRRYLYIVMIATGLVEKYDALTLQKAGQAQAGLSPAQIVVTSDGSTLYLSDFDLTFQQQFVTRINASTMMPTGEIEVEGYAPHGVTLSTDETKLYTMNAGSDDISEIDLATHEVVRHIPIVPGAPPAPAGAAQHEPYQSVIAPDGLMYVTCRRSGQVRVVDLGLGRVVDSITVGSRPLIPGLSTVRNELWVPNQGTNSVSVIDLGSRTVEARIFNLSSQPHTVVFSKDGTRAYVSCENQHGPGNLHHPTGGHMVPGIVFAIDAASRRIEKTIEVAGFAAGMVVR